MRTDFIAINDFENFLMAEFNTMSGAPAPAHDRFEAGMRIVNSMSEDLALDLVETDIADLY
ncbi:MAG: hypothetical protein HN719_07090 [Alphaproteobacteria bacterium]|mgnify:FL=1|jgi:hypothetical protein|nr:hypothetical protein [Alphaproteobacteria bacterium]